MNEPLDGVLKECHTSTVVWTYRAINTVGLEAPSVNQQDQDLLLQGLALVSVCWLGVGCAGLPFPAASAAVRVRDLVCRWLFVLVLR